jgi:RNA polymerase sigma-70 factor (ECF subfamily)
MNDIELRQMLKSAPERGQRAFYDKYFNYVYTIVYARLRSYAEPEDIDECVGDVFAHCFFYFDKQEEINGDLKAFVAAVARNKAVDTYRRVARHKERNVAMDDNEEFISDENIAETAETSEMRQLLYDKVGELGEPDSTIIIQKYFYGRSSKEIAKIVELSSDNVRARCSRAVKRLRELLLQAGFAR